MSESTQQDQQDWPPPARAWYGVGVFTLVTALALVDRQVLSMLVEPIKSTLHISDTRMSLLLGFAFAMFYAIIGLPIARLADVKSRRLIIGLGVALWSIMTALSGLAQNYWHLLLARMGVGAGESCYTPAVFSIIGDSFPREKLAKANAVVSIGFYLGTGAALIVGGTIVTAAAKMPNIHLPVIGEIYPWQITFIVVGLPGLLVACLLRTVHEPRRRGLLRPAGMQDQPEKPKSLPLSVILKWLRDDWRTYFSIYGGTAVAALAGVGANAWVPTFFVRTYGWSLARVGWYMGPITLTVAPVGLLIGGFMAEWFQKHGRHDANMRVALLSSLAAVPFAIMYPLMSTGNAALALYAVNLFLVSLRPGAMNAALVVVTPNQMRAQASALYFFLFNIIGLGLGPLLIASLTDHLFQSDADLCYSLAVYFTVLGPLGCLVIWFGLSSYRESVIRANERE